MSQIDLLILNNCPSFYKINLYNEINKNCKIYVIFIALTDQVIINDNFRKNIMFPYSIIEKKHIDIRNRIKCFMKLMMFKRKLEFKFIIYGGYDLPEFRLLLFFTRRSKNCLQSESSIKESKINGLKRVIKKILLWRISTVLPASKLHSIVFEYLNFKGKYIETKGVGIFNKKSRKSFKRLTHDSIKYLYVGRLIRIKNLENLIDVFNRNGKSLTIVGKGELESKLKNIAKSNINFMGFIPNENLWKIYIEHDVFILPSISEPWGLVVEEAIYFGLPVLISDAVGCQDEMVIKPNTGVVFPLGNEISLDISISKIENNINMYRENCNNFNFEIRDNNQVNAYLKILN